MLADILWISIIFNLPYIDSCKINLKHASSTIQVRSIFSNVLSLYYMNLYKVNKHSCLNNFSIII